MKTFIGFLLLICGFVGLLMTTCGLEFITQSTAMGFFLGVVPGVSLMWFAWQGIVKMQKKEHGRSKEK